MSFTERTFIIIINYYTSFYTPGVYTCISTIWRVFFYECLDLSSSYNYRENTFVTHFAQRRCSQRTRDHLATLSQTRRNRSRDRPIWWTEEREKKRKKRKNRRDIRSRGGNLWPRSRNALIAHRAKDHFHFYPGREKIGRTRGVSCWDRVCRDATRAKLAF